MRTYQKKIDRTSGILLLILAMLFGISVTARAEGVSYRTATATGTYRDPGTGVIEDAGGSDNEALGQSMVENVVDSTALIEEASAGGYYVTLRFHLMDQLSKIDFSVQKPGSSSWSAVTSEQTGSGEDQADWRLSVETEDSIIRSECYVEAMGRSVIFYVTLSDFRDGNEGGFATLDSSAGILDGVTGLTTGGGNDTVDSENASATLNAASKAGSGEPQQLNLGASVWWMLLIIVFCGNILAALTLTGVKLLISRRTGRGRKQRNLRDERENEEDEQEFGELSDEDWEALQDEEE